MVDKTVSTEQEKKKQGMAMENNIMEIEQLRSELNTFKERLDKQQIVNDQLMRQSMKSKMSWIRKMLWIRKIPKEYWAVFFTRELNFPSEAWCSRSKKITHIDEAVAHQGARLRNSHVAGVAAVVGIHALSDCLKPRSH